MAKEIKILLKTLIALFFLSLASAQTLYSVNNNASIENANYRATFYPENITCLQYGANGNFQQVCDYNILVEDFLGKGNDACVNLTGIKFQDNVTSELIYINMSYGKIEDYYMNCTKYYINNETNQTDKDICLIREKVVTKSYMNGTDYCNMDNQRLISGRFFQPYMSSGKFDVYIPFIGWIDPYWYSDSSNFTNGTFTNTFLNGTFVQLNLSLASNGSYLSEIFNAGANSQWNNISWVQEVNYSGELPDNQAVESTTDTFIRGTNMTGNVLLLHLNNDSAYGENDTIVNDFSGNGYDGGVTGATPTPSGKLNGGYSFDGNNDYINFGDLNQLDNNVDAVSAWVKVANIPSAEMAIVTKQSGGGAYLGWRFTISATSGNANFIIRHSGVNYASNSNGNVADNQWHHLVGVNNGSNILFYVDGILKNTGSAWSDGDHSNTISLRVGNSAGVVLLNFNGTLDEVAIWNRSLSAQEIQDIYLRGAVRLNLSVRSCDDASCSGETFTDITDQSPQTLSIANNTYFQYNVSFESDDYNFTPQLYNVSLGYEVLDTAPNLTNVINHSSFVNEAFSYTINATDDSGIDSFYLNDTSIFIINSTTGLLTNSTNLSTIETYWLNVSVNDTTGNIDSEVFYIDIIAKPNPSYVFLIYPNQSEDLNIPYIKIGENLKFK